MAYTAEVEQNLEVVLCLALEHVPLSSVSQSVLLRKRLDRPAPHRDNGRGSMCEQQGRQCSETS